MNLFSVFHRFGVDIRALISYQVMVMVPQSWSREVIRARVMSLVLELLCWRSSRGENLMTGMYLVPLIYKNTLVVVLALSV